MKELTIATDLFLIFKVCVSFHLLKVMVSYAIGLTEVIAVSDSSTTHER